MFKLFNFKRAEKVKASTSNEQPSIQNLHSDLEFIVSQCRSEPGKYSNIEFTDDEIVFLKALVQACHECSLNPRDLKFSRLSTMCFNVFTPYCYVGKINLYQGPTKYSVIKIGGKRPSKTFDTIEEAQAFLSEREGYNIVPNNGNYHSFMQLLIGENEIRELHDPSLDECIDAIPYWVRRMKFCKHN